MSTYYVLWYSKLFLSKMPHFVILWEARVFFRFVNFVKNAQFCHFLRGPWIFSLLQFSKNAQFCHFVRGPWIFFASSILSKLLNFVIFWETRVFFRFFNFVKNAQFCHFLREESVFFFFTFSILSQIMHFVIFEKWTSNYEISINILWVHTMCCDIANYFLSKILHFVILWEARVFFASSILSKIINFVILWEDRGFFRFFNFVKIA